jgi:hypothetical protein
MLAQPAVCEAKFLPHRIHTATALQKHEVVNSVSDKLAVHYDNSTENIDHPMWAECSLSVTAGGSHSYHRPVTYRAITVAQFAFIPHTDPQCQYEPNCLFPAHPKHKTRSKETREKCEHFFSN